MNVAYGSARLIGDLLEGEGGGMDDVQAGNAAGCSLAAARL